MAHGLEPRPLLECLSRHQVRCVLIGALAAVLHGSPVNTNDADICPEESPANLERLAAALAELEARIFTFDEPDGLPFKCDAQMLASARIWNFVTKFGRLDVAFEPSGTGGYDDLHRDARIMDAGGGVKFEVASLLDVVRSKEAAGRDKDRGVLPLLREMLDRFGED